MLIFKPPDDIRIGLLDFFWLERSKELHFGGCLAILAAKKDLMENILYSLQQKNTFLSFFFICNKSNPF